MENGCIEPLRALPIHREAQPCPEAAERSGDAWRPLEAPASDGIHLNEKHRRSFQGRN